MSAVLVMVVVSATASVARADVMMPPPDDCVAGSRGVECHGPGRCEPAACDDTTSCEAGQTCQVLELCVDWINCCGGWGDPCQVMTVTGSCASGAPCERGSCQTVRVCAPGEDPGEDASVAHDATTGEDATTARDSSIGSEGYETARWGCGCRASGATSTSLLLGPSLVLLVVVGTLLRRRDWRGGA